MTEEVNYSVGQLLEAINNKADLDGSNLDNTSFETFINSLVDAKLNNIDYVIESKLPTTEDPTWYRLYKSGWVEQGGYNYESTYTHNSYIKQDLIIPMKDINYQVILTMCRKDGSIHSGHSWEMQADNYTTTTFNYFARGGDEAIYKVSTSWQVSGQSA